MDRPKRRVRGTKRYIAGLEAVDGPLVRIPTDELPVLGDIDLVAEGLGQILVAGETSRSAKRSAIATSLTGPGATVPPAAVRASPTAPLPRPPQPIRASWIVLSLAAWTAGAICAAAAAVARMPAFFRKSRRVVDVLMFNSCLHCLFV
jgi:hypothetical protein